MSRGEWGHNPRRPWDYRPGSDKDLDRGSRSDSLFWCSEKDVPRSNACSGCCTLGGNRGCYLDRRKK